MTSATIDIDPYAELGISPDAEPEAIEGAFRALARKYHPDVNPDGADRMKRINLAHDLLRDAAARQRWQSKRQPSSGAARAPKPPRAEKARPSSPPPPPPPSCTSCGKPVEEPGLCHGCHTRELWRGLWITGILFAVVFGLALAGLHVLWKAALLGYMAGALPSGVDVLSQAQDARKYSSLSTWLAEPAPWESWKQKLSWAAACAAVVVIGGAMFAPVDWATAVRELWRMRNGKGGV
jgi:DnaJ domain